LLEIDRYERSLISSLSKGTAQKVQFIATVLHRPQFVILDEPFTGLDPLSREHLSSAIGELTKQGTTLLLSTHDMAAAEELCDSYIMLFRGKKVLDGTREEVLHAHGSMTIRVRCSPPLPALLPLPGVVRRTDTGDFHALELDTETDPQDLLRDILTLSQVQHFEITEVSLKDIFLRLARD
jgi:ABC-2 type transport system ATP-binding protein